jgi:hypothetical protein
MDYDQIAAHFLLPTGNEQSTPPLPLSGARRVRDALEAVATIGWWSRPASEAWGALGHDFFDGYVWGRAASLGQDVASSVVVSAFGVFSGTLLAPVYEHGRSISSRDAILAARADGASKGLREATAGIGLDVIDRLSACLLEVLTTVEPGPRHLFGALQGLDLPTDPHGRLWRAAELFREHRGDGHLAACVAAGLDMAEMNVFTETWLGYPLGEYSATRGFSPEQLANAAAGLKDRGWIAADSKITEAGRQARLSIEEATDLSQLSVMQRLQSSTDAIVTDAELVSRSVLAHHAAPADPRKRAAG